MKVDTMKISSLLYLIDSAESTDFSQVQLFLKEEIIQLFSHKSIIGFLNFHEQNYLIRYCCLLFAVLIFLHSCVQSACRIFYTVLIQHLSLLVDKYILSSSYLFLPHQAAYPRWTLHQLIHPTFDIKNRVTIMVCIHQYY